MIQLSGTWLFLDTACPRGVVGVVHDGRVVGENFMHEPMRHAEQIADVVATSLQQANASFADLSGIIVGQGPGSFIGVRIAIAYAKGVAVALRIPMIGVSTLRSFIEDSNRRIDIVAIDARKQQFYVQQFPSKEIICVDYQQLPKLAAPNSWIIGFGFEENNVVLDDKRIIVQRGPSALGMLSALHEKSAGGLQDETHTLIPLYVREPIGS